MFRENKFSNTKKAFTLVELLIVIAIIGILSAIAVASGTAAKRVARDNQRKTDIKLLQIKLESYRDEKGNYPTALSSLPPTLPTDPANKTSYTYIPLKFSSGSVCGASYYLYATLENSDNSISHPSIPSSIVTCGSALPSLPLIMGTTNSRTTSNRISPITTGNPHVLFLRKSVTHPKYGIRITTLPTTSSWGTPCPLPQSVRESYS